MDEDERWETTEHKSLEEYVLEQIDTAAKTQEVPAEQALRTANFMKGVVIFLAFYTALVAFACTYAIWEVEKQAARNTKYLQNQCITGNVSRGLEKSLWDTVFLEDAKLAELQGEKITPEERAALKRIEDRAIAAYPQRDCERVDDGDVVNLTPSAIPSPKG